jgi:hypothetical protein
VFIIDDLLALPLKLPVAGFNWIMKQIQTMANEELLNDQPWKERLIELGEISEEDYGREEAQVFAALREIRARREEMAREMAAARGEEESEGGIGIYTGYGKG